MKRDTELWQRAVSYASVGATQAVDLLRYPPPGYRPIERRSRIGHGDARFEWASIAVMTWKVQRNSGFRVEVARSPAAVTDMTYVPVAFDDTGEPVQAASVGDASEETFGPDGSALIVPGDTANLGIPFGPFVVKAPVRVVYVVDEPKRRGFAYGTLPGHPENGEEGWFVDQKEDGSVWMTVRAFSRPANAAWWMVYPVLRVVQEFYTRRYLRALAGPTN
jgi:uncharacterized protein (UPF0548 family)